VKINRKEERLPETEQYLSRTTARERATRLTRWLADFDEELKKRRAKLWKEGYFQIED
jgi:hypothetical protein